MCFRYIQPICLPTGRYAQEKFTHSLPMALGWGTTYYDGQEVPILRGVPLPVWTNEDCDSAYFQPITEVFLCAGYADGGRDACQVGFSVYEYSGEFFYCSFIYSSYGNNSNLKKSINLSCIGIVKHLELHFG